MTALVIPTAKAVSFVSRWASAEQTDRLLSALRETRCRKSARYVNRCRDEEGTHSSAHQGDRYPGGPEHRRPWTVQDLDWNQFLRPHARIVCSSRRIRSGLKARGDLEADQHHTVEDVGIVLGQAFDKALGNKKGILRAGYFSMPMDETLGLAAVDFCGRTSIVVDTKVRVRLVGDLQAELVHDFFEGFARGARANVHTRVLYGRSNHHKIESLFKAFARAVRAACWRDRRMARFIPSTKGVL